MTTKDMINIEKYDSMKKLMDLAPIDELLEQMDENIELLDEKLKQFRSEFNSKFYGYSPEFLSDILFVQNLKISE